jgi:hypothetical protein
VTGNTPTRSPRLPNVFAVAVIWLAATLLGCGATQFEPKNRHLLEALQTAVTSKNSEWLSAAAKQVEQQQAKQGLSKAEYKALKDIVDSAQAGDWKTAESRLFALSEGQKPTAADQARVKERKSAK